MYRKAYKIVSNRVVTGFQTELRQNSNSVPESVQNRLYMVVTGFQKGSSRTLTVYITVYGQRSI